MMDLSWRGNAQRAWAADAQEPPFTLSSDIWPGCLPPQTSSSLWHQEWCSDKAALPIYCLRLYEVTCYFSRISPLMNKMGRKFPQWKLFLLGFLRINQPVSASAHEAKEIQSPLLFSIPGLGTVALYCHPNTHWGLRWRDGCFFRRPRFNSQCSLGNPQLLVIPVPEDPVPSSGLWEHCMWEIYLYR